MTLEHAQHRSVLQARRSQTKDECNKYWLMQTPERVEEPDLPSHVITKKEGDTNEQTNQLFEH